MRLCRGALFTAWLVALAVPTAAIGAKIVLEAPTSAEPSAELLLRELQQIERSLGPHEVSWLQPDAPTPSGSWALRKWEISDQGRDLQVIAEFTSPHRTAPAYEIGSCEDCLEADRKPSGLVIENALRDLLNRTLLHPTRGFMGYVEAPLCEREVDNVYRFSRAKLDAPKVEPGLSTIQARFWPEIFLAMDVPEYRTEPFLFGDPSGESTRFINLLKDRQHKDVSLRIDNLSTRAEIQLLDGEVCAGAAVQDRKLRLYLKQTPVPQIYFGTQSRTDSSTGGR